jgi:4-carboxymuconolactone decarboxylase
VPRSYLEGIDMKNKELHESGLKVGEKVYGSSRFDDFVTELSEYDKELADYLVENAFGQVLARPGLDFKTRMLCNVAALAAMGIEPLLRSYIRGALRAGASKQEVTEVLIQMHLYAGWPRCVLGLRVMKEVFKE